MLCPTGRLILFTIPSLYSNWYGTVSYWHIMISQWNKSNPTYVDFPIEIQLDHHKSDCHQRQQRYKNRSKSVVNWSKTFPSGDSPEGRQPEVPEPAKVRTNSIKAFNQFSIQFLFSICSTSAHHLPFFHFVIFINNKFSPKTWHFLSPLKGCGWTKTAFPGRGGLALRSHLRWAQASLQVSFFDF